MDVQTYTAPDGAERVSMPRSEYQDLIDARDHAIAMRDVAAGSPVLTEAELDTYLAAPSPLAFWRKRARLTQAALAQKVGVSQAFLAQIEAGDRDGTVGVLKRISDALGVKIEDVILGAESQDTNQIRKKPMFAIDEGWVTRLHNALIPTASSRQGWLVAQHVDTAFIEPTLKVIHGDPYTAKVLIVAAPGAVGKSTYARNICSKTSAVLVDLSQTGPLGDNFFIGGVANAFGYQALAELATGKIALVVDALDEAQLRSGSEGFSAGLLDLCKIVQSDTALPATLLGRAAAAEEAWLVLADAGMCPCLLEIDYFDDIQSKAYLTCRLPAIAGARDATRAAFEKHGAKFVELALATRNELTSTPGGEEARFCGYAPVLDAICSYALDESDLNPSARLPGMTAAGPVGLIKQIAISILNREQSKLTAQVTGAPHDLDLSTLYKPEEQLRRLAAVILGGSSPTGPTISDPAFRQTYERMVSEFAPQHPFLSSRGGPANAAFAAYILVWAITSDNARLEARRTLSLQPGLGSGLFFEMYMNWLASGVESERELDLADVGALYVSFTSQAVQGEQPTLEITGDPADIMVGVAFEMMSPTSELGDGGRTFGPYEASRNNVLEFKGPVGGLQIAAPISVIVGDGRTVSVTAPAEIDVDLLELDGRELRVYKPVATTGPESARVTMAALDASVARIERVVVHGANLSVTFDQVSGHPWADYVVQRPPAPNARIASLRRRARKILTSFRSHNKGALVRFSAKIEHARMMKEGEEGPALLQKLKDDGILTTFSAGKFYELHADRLADQFNMDYQALQLQQWTAEADTYLGNIDR